VDGEVSRTYVIQVSSEELQRMMSSLQSLMNFLSGQTGGGGAPSEEAKRDAEEAIYKGTKKSNQDPSFRSIFAPLVALEGIKQLITNSRVANTYLSSMGKVFSAAIDLLLLPLTPIFNLLLVLLAKLLPHIIRFTEWLQPKIEKFLEWIEKVWNAIKEGNLKQLGGLLLGGAKDPNNWIGGLATVGGLLIGGQLLMRALGLGRFGPLALGGALLARTGIPGLFTAGRGPFPAFGFSLGRLAGGGALMIGGELLAHQFKGNDLARTAGMIMTGAGIGFSVGGPPGALIGAGTASVLRLAEEAPGPIGGFARGVSRFFGFAPVEQPRRTAAQPQPTGNVTYIGTQTINVNVRGESTEKVLREVMNNYDQYLMRQARYG